MPLRDRKTPKEIPLDIKMIQIADRDNLPEDHTLRVKALELKNVLMSGEFESKKLLGAWARAKKAYCEYTDEPLVDPAAIETGAKLVALLSGNVI